MQLIWSIKLYRMTVGWRVVIEGDGRRSQGQGHTPQEAHRRAEAKLVVKPWVGAERYTDAECV